MNAALRLDRRLERAAQALSYLLVNVPIALVGALGVLVVVLGAALSIIAIGLPILLGAAAVCRRLVRFDRRAANDLLGTQVPPLPAGAQSSGGPWHRSLEVLSDRSLWRVMAVLAMKLPLVAGLLVVGLAPIVLLAELVNLSVQAIGGLGAIDYFGPWSFGPGVGLVLLAFTLPTAVLAIAALDAEHAVLSTVTPLLLAPRMVGEGPVREMLAESLGDRTVSIAYWLPDREAFVDEIGRPVKMPERGSGRTWTAVERDGRRVAAIVHSAALDTTPELVQAAAAASSLAIDNERLKADLRARLEELRVSRRRIVEATDDARRRIERDLHDGAQQQLVALALQLRILRARAGDPELQSLVDDLAAGLSTAIEELRELARGIHPAILTERGLVPAIASLAERSPIPVEQDLDVAQRLPASIEAAAYFVVAEGLTNVFKYAHASTVRVELRREKGELLVAVSDDGAGGADPEAGSGLRGLHDRVAAVDGALAVESPPGAGTRLVARLPLAVAEEPEPAERREVSA